MNATLKMREVPKGLFDSAMTKFGRQFGEGFGGLIESLNKDKKFCAQLVEIVKKPDVAFVRLLLKHIGSPAILEELQEALSNEGCGFDTERLLHRAYHPVRSLYSRFESHRCSDYNFVDITIEQIKRNNGFGLVAIQNLVSQLVLRHDTLEYLTKNKVSLDWTKLKCDKTLSVPDNLSIFDNKSVEFLGREQRDILHLRVRAMDYDTFIYSLWDVLNEFNRPGNFG